jgi:protein-tyrosine phosphatase
MDPGSQRPTRVLMVCLGNICRSPIAEVVFRDRAEAAGLAVIVDSAGTGRWHTGSDADPRARRVLEEHDYDFEHSARTFDTRWFDERDLILAMDLDNLDDLRRMARTPQHKAKVRLIRSYDPALSGLAETSQQLAVPDPYYGGADGFEEVLAMLERASDGLVAHLKSQAE